MHEEATTLRKRVDELEDDLADAMEETEQARAIVVGIAVTLAEAGVVTIEPEA